MAKCVVTGLLIGQSVGHVIFTFFLKVIRHEAIHNWETWLLLCVVCYLLAIFVYLNTDPVLSHPRMV